MDIIIWLLVFLGTTISFLVAIVGAFIMIVFLIDLPNPSNNIYHTKKEVVKICLKFYGIMIPITIMGWWGLGLLGPLARAL